MFGAFRYSPFRLLFAAHVVALIGTGLSTIAIGLLVVSVAEQGAAGVLGTILGLKMLTFLLIGPLAPAVAQKIGTKRLLVITDLTRAAIAVTLPFVENIGVAYVLIVILQSAAALFTPTFQATIPTIVTDTDDYNGALALSRLAYDMEALASPSIAGLILIVAPSSVLFFGTAGGFLASALLIISVAIPKAVPDGSTSHSHTRKDGNLTRGIRLMISHPSLRGTLLLHLALAAVGSIPMVLTVPLVLTELHGTEGQAANLLAAFGLGSLISAAMMPVLVRKMGPRRYMLTGLLLSATAFTLTWPALTLSTPLMQFAALCVIWCCAGVGNSAVLTPMGRVLRDSVHSEDLPHVFAAQFSLAHGWWLITYPLAGWGASLLGYGPMTLMLALFGLGTLLCTARIWPRIDNPTNTDTIEAGQKPLRTRE